MPQRCGRIMNIALGFMNVSAARGFLFAVWGAKRRDTNRGAPPD
jgi:hypothetical protein